MRRKFLLSTFFFIGGILIAYSLYHAFSIKVIGIVILIFAILFQTKYMKKLSFIFLILGILSMLTTSFLIGYNPLNRYAYRTVNGIFKVESVSMSRDGYWDFLCTLRGTKPESHNILRGKVLLSYKGKLEDPMQLTGSTISAVTKLKIPDKSPLPGQFSYREYLYSRGIHYTGRISAFRPESKRKNLFDRGKTIIYEKRSSFLKGFGSNECAAFLKGIIFGDTSSMKDEFIKTFQDNGTAHILAVSGLHIGILYSLFKVLMDRLRHPAVLIGFLSFLFFYGTITMWSVSVRRASALIMMKILADRFDLRFDLTTALSFISFIILINNPYALFNTSFQLSFLAVLSIIFFCPVTTELFGDIIGIPLGVQIGILPYTIFCFNRFSLISLFINIPVVYLASIIVPAGLLIFSFFSLTGLLPSFLRIIPVSLSNLLIALNSFMHNHGRFCIELPSPHLSVLLFIYMTAFLLFSEEIKILIHRKDYRLISLLLSLFLVTSLGGASLNTSPLDKCPLKIIQLNTIAAIQTDDTLYYFNTDGFDKLDDEDKAGEEEKLKSYVLKNRIRNCCYIGKKNFHDKMDNEIKIKRLNDRIYTIQYGNTSLILGSKKIMELPGDSYDYFISTEKSFIDFEDKVYFLSRIQALGIDKNGNLITAIKKQPSVINSRRLHKTKLFP